jgi:hypothetical protein
MRTARAAHSCRLPPGPPSPSRILPRVLLSGGLACAQTQVVFGLVTVVHALVQCAVHPLGLFAIQSTTLLAKALGWTHASWWAVLVPLLLPWGAFALGAVGLASAATILYTATRLSPRCRTRVTECITEFFVWKPRASLVVISLLLVNAVFVPAFLSVAMAAAAYVHARLRARACVCVVCALLSALTARAAAGWRERARGRPCAGCCWRRRARS